MTIEIKDSEIEALKWLTLKGMEMTKSNQKFKVFERISDLLRGYQQVKVEPEVMPKITDVIEECAKIAETYEPDEKLDYVTYASRDIRKLKKVYLPLK